jgi:hypothetical protein
MVMLVRLTPARAKAGSITGAGTLDSAAHHAASSYLPAGTKGIPLRAPTNPV